MFLYEKKIIYLSYYREGVKESSAGFARVSRERDASLLEIHIKNMPGVPEGNYALFLVLKNREIQWGMISAQKGGINIEKRISVQNGTCHIGEETFKEETLCGILIHLDGKQWIAGYWQQPDKAHESAIKQEIVRTEMKPDIIHAGEEKDKDKSVNGGELYAADKLVETASGDKWEQLQRNYRKIHPFGDERLFLSIEPKDFVVLQAAYQKLVNNSFLLHGYYNYRHLILGPDAEIGDRDRNCFYLGVPGTYFEREKMVAVMFGFEGFECSGPVEIGKFGYYMRRVEL